MHDILKCTVPGLVSGLVLSAGCAHRPSVSIERVPLQASEDISSVLAEQVAAWNAGDIDAFMQPYWRSEELTFISARRDCSKVTG